MLKKYLCYCNLVCKILLFETVILLCLHHRKYIVRLLTCIVRSLHVICFYACSQYRPDGLGGRGLTNNCFWGVFLQFKHFLMTKKWFLLKSHHAACSLVLPQLRVVSECHEKGALWVKKIFPIFKVIHLNVCLLFSQSKGKGRSLLAFHSPK